MTTQEDQHHVWVNSPLFGSFRIQRYGDEIVNVSDCGALYWTKSVKEALEWVERMEQDAVDTLKTNGEAYTEYQKEVMMWYEDEKKRNAILMETRWGDKTNSDVC